MFLMVKVFLLLAALSLHDVVAKPVPPTLLFVVPLSIISFISTVAIWHTLFLSLILSLAAFVYFWLLSYFPSGGKYYAIMLLGGIGLMAI
ncbi:hypothetical protein Q4567_19040 [Aliiglaciecola sp. 2_MG-2023]|uniref:hypothetical protein n=1 Tax=unclassified Aliiglaciecola TaxID=2593648 RepID=UPI0026E24366|nr:MULTISPECIES: hypothetical protein [unclassified Aliiglaciecola]MDO6712837.1 hypothetical protein [Aliiglaciecola sp. 2_MG-2023]MDO6753932.1 hypothetical protein [Aliiglaciecola sp. 1_MG-2023]